MPNGCDCLCSGGGVDAPAGGLGNRALDEPLPYGLTCRA